MKIKLLSIAAALVLIMPQAASADAASDFYNGKTVKVLIGGSMGGAYGLYAQLLSRHVNRHLAGTPTVVDSIMDLSKSDIAGANKVYQALLKAK